jgi:ABC-type branched-subunit amino acid transport system substrate-binding protein
MKRGRSLKTWAGISILGALILVGTIGAAYGQKAEVTIGIIAHLTGPYGPATRGINEGAMDAIEAVNKWEPISGIRLKAVWVDGASSPAKSLSALKKMVSQHNPVIVVGWTTPSALATKGYYIKQKIASVEAGGADPLWELPSWTFSAQSPYVNQLGGWIDYYLKNIWPKKGLNRKPNFAWATWDNAAGRASITDKSRDYIRSKGVNIVPGDGEFFPVAPTEVSAQMMRLQRRDVDFTYGMLLFPTAAAILKGMDKMRLIDRIDVGMSIPNPPDIVRQAGPLCRNVYASDYWWPPGEWPEKCPRILQMYNEKNRVKLPKFLYGAGFGWGLTAAEAVRMAAAAVGPNNVNGEASYNALKRMKNYGRWNVGVPVGFGEKKRFGCDSTVLYRLNNNKVNTVGVMTHPNLTKFEY